MNKWQILEVFNKILFENSFTAFERQMLKRNVQKASFPDWSRYQHKRLSKISLLPSFLQNRNGKRCF